MLRAQDILSPGTQISTKLSRILPLVLEVILITPTIRAVTLTVRPYITLINSTRWGICTTSPHCIRSKMEQICMPTSNPVSGRPSCIASSCTLACNTTRLSKAMYFRIIQRTASLEEITLVLASGLLALFRVPLAALGPLGMVLASMQVSMIPTTIAPASRMAHNLRLSAFK